MSTAFTFYFNEIIANYDDWKEVMSDIVNYDDEIESAFDLYCHKLISRHYHNVNVRYSEPDAFIFELQNVYENKFKQFLKQKQIIDEVYKLTNDDIVTQTTGLNNLANNPNEEPSDPTKPLNFISAQSLNIVKDSKVRAYLTALNSIPTLNIYNFFKAQNEYEMSFDDLFMQVIPNNYGVYRREL